MIKTVEAMIDSEGNIRLVDPVKLGVNRRVLVVILDELDESAHETALLTEDALKDWNRPEEEAAWSHLQPAK